MARFDRDRRNLHADRAQALDHPIRLRILELFTQNPTMSLAAEPLALGLHADFPEVKSALVAYHLAILKDAQLIPKQ